MLGALSASELKAVLREHGLRLTKRLGQHHLVDPRAIERIVDRCELSGSDLVVEIGAGLGALTEPLARRAGRVIAVEVDRGIAALLTQRMAPYPQVTVRCQDILDFAWEGRGRVTVVGAIPYHITSPILVALSEHRAAIHRAVVVVQQEVARRLAAAPGCADYGRLSLLAQYGWEVSKLFDVPRSAFFPQPDVDSACIRLLARGRPAVAVSDEAAFFGIVKAAFGQRRKTLVNCLNGLNAWTGRSDIEAALRRLELPLTIRGEALSISQFAALTQLLSGQRDGEKMDTQPSKKRLDY